MSFKGPSHGNHMQTHSSHNCSTTFLMKSVALIIAIQEEKLAKDAQLTENFMVSLLLTDVSIAIMSFKWAKKYFIEIASIITFLTAKHKEESAGEDLKSKLKEVNKQPFRSFFRFQKNKAWPWHQVCIMIKKCPTHTLL